MPAFNDKADWDGAYLSGVSLSSGRRIMVPGYWRAIQFEGPHNSKRVVGGTLSKFGLGPSDEILVVGGGFGYLAEEITRIFPGNIVVSTDISTWVQIAKDQTETADLRTMVTGLGLDPDKGDGLELMQILDLGVAKSKIIVMDEDLVSSPSRKAVKDAAGLKGGQKFKLAVTDDVLPTLDDAAAVALTDNMRAISTVTAHLVTPLRPDLDQDPGYNWKTISDWNSLVGPARIVDLTTFSDVG